MTNKNYTANTVTEMEIALDKYGWDYSSTALRKIANESITAKEMLYDLFGKHPNWDAEEGRIILQDDIIRPFSTYAIGYFMNEICSLNNCYKVISHEKMNTLRFIMYRVSAQYLKNCEDKEIADDLNKVNALYRIRPEMKISKVIARIMKVEGLDKLDGYGKLFSSMADDTNPKKIRKHVILSLNPVDFLMMSNGDSWNSCHWIDADDPGCHCAGSISYMLDNNTFLFYTVNLSYDGRDFETQEREEREVFAYNGEMLFQSRLYPQSCDFGADEVYKNNREIVQRVIDECIKLQEKETETWTCEDNNNEVNDFVFLGRNAQCYPDWTRTAPGSKHCRVAFKGKRNPDMPRIQLGKQARCIECGEKHYENGTLNCCTSGYRCYSCGDRIDAYDVYWVNDEPYCPECVTACDCCGEYVVKGNDGYIVTYDGYTVCDHCFEYGDVVVYVADLGDYYYHYESNCIYLEEEGEWYYRGNRGDTWDYCEECGKAFIIGDLQTYKGDLLCEDCYAEKEEEDSEGSDDEE